MLFIQHGLGDLALAENNLPRVDASLFEKTLQLACAVRMGRGVVLGIAGLAVVAAAEANIARAGGDYGAVWKYSSARRESPSFGRHTRYEEIISACSYAAPIAFAAATEHGLRMTSEEIIEYALSGI